MTLLNDLKIPRDCDESFIHQVETESGQQISKCYQCGNCSASCAYTYVYDYPVHQIMRLIEGEPLPEPGVLPVGGKAIGGRARRRIEQEAVHVLIRAVVGCVRVVVVVVVTTMHLI